MLAMRVAFAGWRLARGASIVSARSERMAECARGRRLLGASFGGWRHRSSAERAAHKGTWRWREREARETFAGWRLAAIKGRIMDMAGMRIACRAEVVLMRACVYDWSGASRRMAWLSRVESLLGRRRERGCLRRALCAWRDERRALARVDLDAGVLGARRRRDRGILRMIVCAWLRLSGRASKARAAVLRIVSKKSAEELWAHLRAWAEYTRAEKKRYRGSLYSTVFCCILLHSACVLPRSFCNRLHSTALCRYSLLCSIAFDCIQP